MAQLHESGQAGALSSDVIVTPAMQDEGGRAIKAALPDAWEAMTADRVAAIARAIYTAMERARTARPAR